ncbi:hypothetical protein OS493_006731 [Desmophyllum pertusum]|uniref:Integrase core domain-containing protein n=1 Tax=Desmophyllum pertusum TaxID=174260 RepID=A0A9W9ZT93_9CNID|nr:hypothetical protein OS493_006731 [Desmophyllum pertusum]
MMTGYVRSKGLTLSGRQVSKSLQRVNPVNHARRREDTVRRRNPVPYYAPYHGNKLHCDQNEKLGMYGCTFYALSDGCSSRIVKLFSMPKKNAVIIYAHFREILLHEGIWDMVRVDHGTEACLMLFVQNLLRNERGNLGCEPYVQTQSRQNLPAERKWPEVNQRIIYPIKDVLVRMENGLLINLYDPVVQFCVSFITMNVAEVGLQRVVASWNSHSIEGKSDRIPDVVAQRTSRVHPVNSAMVPSVEDAIQMYTDAGAL